MIDAIFFSWSEKTYFFVLCYANLYRFNLAFNFNPQFCISHVFGSLCGWYLDDICEKADQKFSANSTKCSIFYLVHAEEVFGKKTFVLCVLWSGFKRDQVEFVMNAF